MGEAKRLEIKGERLDSRPPVSGDVAFDPNSFARCIGAKSVKKHRGAFGCRRDVQTPKLALPYLARSCGWFAEHVKRV
jgi:hypothetical protein